MAGLALFVWLGLTFFLGLSQRSMMYYPVKADAANLERQAAQAGFEPWRDQSGETIGYRSIPTSGDGRTALAILIIHGNAGYALHRVDYARLLRDAAPDRNISLYILEYPGYGARKGSPSQESFIQAATDALAAIPENEPVIVLGESIGTGVASALAAAQPDRVAGLLLLTPFDSLASVAQHHYPILPVRWILRDSYPSSEWLQNYRGPVAIIVAADDTVVPAEFGRKLYENYAGPKKLIVAEHADHNDLLHTLPPSAWQEALQFLL